MKQADESYLHNAEKQPGTKPATRKGKVDENEKQEIPKLFMVLLSELTKQILECQENKFKEEREFFEKELNKKDVKIDQLVSEIKDLRYQIDLTGQQNRKDNLKIIGVPQVENENVNQIVIDLANHIGVDIEESDISVAHRISTKDDKEDKTQNNISGKPKKVPSIIVKWVSRSVKNKIFEKRREITNKTGCPYPEAAIYEDVTPLRSKCYTISAP